MKPIHRITVIKDQTPPDKKEFGFTFQKVERRIYLFGILISSRIDSTNFFKS